MGGDGFASAYAWVSIQPKYIRNTSSYSLQPHDLISSTPDPAAFLFQNILVLPILDL